ncbi:MAG TPA: PIN domain-containing protein [Thermoanaerobaculia bacterium]|nr:PIN domain-containing protein [Thermoanaerobaculia bacterium]
MKRIWVDANVLLRFLTGEPKDLADKAARLMSRAEKGEIVLVLFPLVLAEVVWVLKSFYRHSLDDIADALVPLISADGIEIEDREAWIQAIELARDKNVDFVDAALALQAARRGEPVCSFDGDFKRLPAEWMKLQAP